MNMIAPAVFKEHQSTVWTLCGEEGTCVKTNRRICSDNGRQDRVLSQGNDAERGG